MGRLEVSPEAERDLEDIAFYIAEQSSSLDRSRSFLQLIQRTCKLLATQPEMGQLRPEFATGNYRSFTVGNYVIYFRPIDDGIRIARILHGSRDHESLF
jgi:toxin ParE1/3/4